MQTNPPAPPGGGREFWRSLGERDNSPEAVDALTREFPEGADDQDDWLSRRGFMATMGASATLAAAAGCSPRAAPNRLILPYTKQPEQLTTGLPLFYASAVPMAGLSTGVPVIFGVLTTETAAQAEERAALDRMNKGGESMEAALEMIDLLAPFGAGPKARPKSKPRKKKGRR